MNYIHKLQQENYELRETITALMTDVAYYQHYFMSPKFQGIDNDFAHVSTDVLPKLSHLMATARTMRTSR
jgi:hypothetical protein